MFDALLHIYQLDKVKSLLNLAELLVNLRVMMLLVASCCTFLLRCARAQSDVDKSVA